MAEPIPEADPVEVMQQLCPLPQNNIYLDFFKYLVSNYPSITRSLIDRFLTARAVKEVENGRQ